MFEFINTDEFTRYLSDNERHATTAADIAHAILNATSPRISDISHRVAGSPAANYKAVQRFLAQTEHYASFNRMLLLSLAIPPR